MLRLILSGVVLSCGALLVLSGAAKLYRAARRSSGAGNKTDSDSAIRAALRISPRRWRQVEPAAGLAETATGAAVCAALHPVAAGAALAALGAIFSSLLAQARRTKAPGGCSCVRRSKNTDAAITWPVQARAALLLAAGVVEALVRLPRPTPLTGADAAVAVAAISTLILMLRAEGPWHVGSCRFRIPSRPRATAKALMKHGVFEAMADAAGPFAAGFAHRRDGCVDEFRFTALPRPGRTARTVAFRVSRAARRNRLAVEARIETTPT